MGVEKNPIEAVKWFKKSAEQGRADAQFELGVCYDAGKGVKKNSVEAVKWFKKSAEQGHAQAQLYLGLCYGHGLGVTQDYIEAYKWLLLADANGVEKASSAKKKLETKMSPKQIQTAKQEAKKFRPQL